MFVQKGKNNTGFNGYLIFSTYQTDLIFFYYSCDRQRDLYYDSNNVTVYSFM